MELTEIVARLRAADVELEDVEVKRAGDGFPQNVAETMSAFANSRGGIIILGLDERAGFAAVGVTDSVAMRDKLAGEARAKLTPALAPGIDIIPFEGANLVVAEVEALPLAQRPCYVTARGTPGSRDGMKSRFLRRRRIRISTGWPYSVFSRQRGGIRRGRFPGSASRTRLSASAFWYPAKDLSSRPRRSSRVVGAGRDDYWEIEPEVIREAVVNALMHRDYSPQARGTQIQVELFPDRLTVTSPGGLFGCPA